MNINSIGIAAAVVVLLSLGACAKEEGPMEKMGKSLDDAATSVENTAESVSDDLKKAVED